MIISPEIQILLSLQDSEIHPRCRRSLAKLDIVIVCNIRDQGSKVGFGGSAET